MVKLLLTLSLVSRAVGAGSRFRRGWDASCDVTDFPAAGPSRPVPPFTPSPLPYPSSLSSTRHTPVLSPPPCRLRHGTPSPPATRYTPHYRHPLCLLFSSPPPRPSPCTLSLPSPALPDPLCTAISIPLPITPPTLPNPLFRSMIAIIFLTFHDFYWFFLAGKYMHAFPCFLVTPQAYTALSVLSEVLHVSRPRTYPLLCISTLYPFLPHQPRIHEQKNSKVSN